MPPRAEKIGLGCDGPEQVFLGLCEEIIGRIADLLEGAGPELDMITRQIFHHRGQGPEAVFLQGAGNRRAGKLTWWATAACRC